MSFEFITEEKSAHCIHDIFEAAISNIAYAAKDADGTTLLILQRHLNNLCDLQLEALKVAIATSQQVYTGE